MGVLILTAVVIKNLVKTFGSLRAVDDLSFEVREGEIYGLLGPNGAGKTTTIRILMGLLRPDSGSVDVYNHNPVEDSFEVKKKVGYVPETQLLYESLTPQELFEFVASVRDLPSIKTSARVDKLVRALDFSKHYSQMILTLSAGTRQKAMLIIAMLHAPRLLILDEPFSGLDVRSTSIMKNVLRQHSQDGGSVLFSTHVMEVAEDLCDRVGIIDEGKLVAEGALQELKEKASQESASLEQLFLKLTHQEEEVIEGVRVLRGAFSESE
ncbi:MAG: ABC transporter ATP-binding protein [Candidatus Thorarchaeota archaeon]